MTAYINHVITWDMLRDIIAHSRLHELARSKPTYDEYVKHVTKVKSEYCTIKDYIQIRFLGFPFEPVDATNTIDSTTTKKKQAIADYQPTSTAYLFPNDFPYNFPPNVDHLLLWCTRPLTQEEIDATLPSLLHERYGDTPIEVQQFVNPAVLQSIKEIFHAHICVQR